MGLLEHPVEVELVIRMGCRLVEQEIHQRRHRHRAAKVGPEYQTMRHTPISVAAAVQQGLVDRLFLQEVDLVEQELHHLFPAHQCLMQAVVVVEHTAVRRAKQSLPAASAAVVTVHSEIH